MEEDTVPLLSHPVNYPPPSPPLPSLISHSGEQLPPPPYQQGPVSPRYDFDTNYIKAKVGESPTVRFTVLSDPPLTRDTRHFLTHYNGEIATKRFKVQNDVIEFQEVRLSDTGFYTISCTNTAGLEGKETLELEVFRDFFDAFMKKASKIKHLAFTTRSTSEGSVSENNQPQLRQEAEHGLENQRSTIRDSESITCNSSTIQNPNFGIETEIPRRQIVGTSNANTETPATEITNEAQAGTFKHGWWILFLPLTIIFAWSLPFFIGTYIFYRRANQFSAAQMNHDAQFNTKIARVFFIVWLISIVVGIVVIIATLIKTI